MPGNVPQTNMLRLHRLQSMSDKIQHGRRAMTRVAVSEVLPNISTLTLTRMHMHMRAHAYGYERVCANARGHAHAHTRDHTPGATVRRSVSERRDRHQ